MLSFLFPLSPSRFVSDIKMMLICMGLNPASSLYSCPYATCHRYDGDRVTNKGSWRKREARTYQSCCDLYNQAKEETGDNIVPKKNFGVKHKPLDIWSWEGKEDKPFLSIYCLPPLHLLLGEKEIFDQSELSINIINQSHCM